MTRVVIASATWPMGEDSAPLPAPTAPPPTTPAHSSGSAADAPPPSAAVVAAAAAAAVMAARPVAAPTAPCPASAFARASTWEQQQNNNAFKNKTTNHQKPTTHCNHNAEGKANEKKCRRRARTNAREHTS